MNAPTTVPAVQLIFEGIASFGHHADEQVFFWPSDAPGKRTPLPPCNHLRNHSPDGFAWGYGGSGPAQLSIAILMAVYQNWSLVQRFYQDFKFHVIARFDQVKDWRLTESQVRIWVDERLRVLLHERPDLFCQHCHQNLKQFVIDLPHGGNVTESELCRTCVPEAILVNLLIGPTDQHVYTHKDKDSGTVTIAFMPLPPEAA